MKNKHAPKKHLGQNFLNDKTVRQRIVEACSLTKEDTVVEIGPGQGAITQLIAPKVGRLYCIEKDKDLIEALTNEFHGKNVVIFNQDFLTWNLTDEVEQVKVIGNIPYNISTPILEYLIHCKKNIRQAFLTVQLEFGQRLAAKPGNKDYGSLSCFIQYHADVTILFQIKRGCFHPVPNVDSCFVCIDFTRPQKYFPKDEKVLFRLIRTVFTQRRKNILNAAMPWIPKDQMAIILDSLNIPQSTRPEQLSLQNFVDISLKLV